MLPLPLTADLLDVGAVCHYECRLEPKVVTANICIDRLPSMDLAQLTMQLGIREQKLDCLCEVVQNYSVAVCNNWSVHEVAYD